MLGSLSTVCLLVGRLMGAQDENVFRTTAGLVLNLSDKVISRCHEVDVVIAAHLPAKFLFPPTPSVDSENFETEHVSRVLNS